MVGNCQNPVVLPAQIVTQREKGKPFIVSVKSVDDVVAGMQGSVKFVFYLGIALMIGGAAVAVFFR